MACNTVHTMSIVYKAWCAKNSLPEAVELKDPLHLALWKVTCATFGVQGHKIVRVQLNISQSGANSAFLSEEKSMQVQLNQSMTATMIKRFTGIQRTDLSFRCPEPSPTISVVIEPEFVRKCTESKHVLSVILGLDNGETVTTNIVMQIYSKHSGTRSKLLLNPKEKKPSSPRKGRNTKKSPKKNNKTTRSITVTDPAQKRRVLNSKRNAALVSDESDSEYEDVSSDEEFTIQPIKTVQTRSLRNRLGASSAKNTKASGKALRDGGEDEEKSGESSSDESVSCVNQVDSPQAQENDEIASNQGGFPLHGLTREDREYFQLGDEAVLMDLDEIYYGLQES